jgi:hypothetical protein
MIEKLKSFLLPVKKERPICYSAPPRALRVGPEQDGVPYMFVWYEHIQYANVETPVRRVALEFRNMPKHIIRFDQRAIPDLITALTQLQEEITKDEQQQQ